VPIGQKKCVISVKMKRSHTELCDLIKKSENGDEVSRDILKDEFPHLFTMMSTPDYDRDKLRYMLKKLQDIENNKLNQYDASVKVGKILVDEYVLPKLPPQT
jgi:hypothetical protein